MHRSWGSAKPKPRPKHKLKPKARIPSPKLHTVPTPDHLAQLEEEGERRLTAYRELRSLSDEHFGPDHPWNNERT